MPIYEYVCDGCGSKAELLVASFSTKPPCPKCGSKKMVKQVSAFAAHADSSGRTPCSGGACPSAANASGCSGGKCPFSG